MKKLIDFMIESLSTVFNAFSHNYSEREIKENMVTIAKMSLIAVLLVAIALCFTINISASAANLTAVDALTVLRASVGTAELTAEQRSRYGINRNASVTTADALRVLRISVGLEAPPTPQKSSITLPNRRLTDAERNAWIDEFRALGGYLEFELEVVRLINNIRAENNLSRLEIDETLMMSARFYTQIMRDLETGLGHNMGPYRVEGATHGASANVVLAFGGQLRWNGGNGSWSSGGSPTPESIVNGWMNSPGHRSYIMSPEHRFIGVGTNVGGRERYTYMFMSDTRTPDSGDRWQAWGN
jgi:uncharacterized protein YkwD